MTKLISNRTARLTAEQSEQITYRPETESEPCGSRNLRLFKA